MKYRIREFFLFFMKTPMMDLESLVDLENPYGSGEPLWIVEPLDIF